MEYDLATGIIWYVVMVYSIVFHEAAHAWSAKLLGDATAYHGGQVTLDPTPHIRREPIGLVFLPIVSYVLNGWMMGWASAPIDAQWAERYPKKSATVSMAGPVANLVLVILAGILMLIGARAGVFSGATPGRNTVVHFMSHVVTSTHGPFWEACAMVLSIMFSLNLMLAIFNLMPLPPLDGSAIPLFFLEGKALESYQRMVREPFMMIFGILVAWNGFAVVAGIFFWPVMRWFQEYAFQQYGL